MVPIASACASLLATLFHRHSYRINPQQHLIDRCRHLAGKALGYAPAGPPRASSCALPALRDSPRAPYAVFLHVTSRNDKLWPEAHWIALLEHFTRSGLTVVLPWGKRGGSRAQQAARRGKQRGARAAAAHACPSWPRCSPARRWSSASIRGSRISRPRWGRPRSRCSWRPIRGSPASSRRARARATWATAGNAPASGAGDRRCAARCCARRNPADGHGARGLLGVGASCAAVAAVAPLVARPQRAVAIASTSPSDSAAIRRKLAMMRRLSLAHAVSVGETRAAAPLVQRRCGTHTQGRRILVTRT